MFVRSRPSRTRAERPIPGDRVLDAFDSALIGAHGAALDLVAAYLSRAGTLEADESGRTLGILREQLAKIRRHVRADPMFRHLQSMMDLRTVSTALTSLSLERAAARDTTLTAQQNSLPILWFSSCSSNCTCRNGS